MTLKKVADSGSVETTPAPPDWQAVSTIETTNSNLKVDSNPILQGATVTFTSVTVPPNIDIVTLLPGSTKLKVNSVGVLVDGDTITSGIGNTVYIDGNLCQIKLNCDV